MLKFEPPGPSYQHTQPQRHSSVPLVNLSSLSSGFKRLTQPRDAGAPCLSCSHCLLHLPGAAVPAQRVRETEARHGRHRGRGFRTMETPGCPQRCRSQHRTCCEAPRSGGGSRPAARYGPAVPVCARCGGWGRTTKRGEKGKKWE